MDDIQCPYCGNSVTPSPEGTCPFCRGWMGDDAGGAVRSTECAGEQALDGDRVGQPDELIYVLGLLWIFLGLICLSFYPLVKLIWGLIWLGLGVVVCFRQLWAVGIGLLVSYWKVLSLLGAVVFLGVFSSSVVVLGSLVAAGLVLAHYVLFRAAKQRRLRTEDQSLRTDAGHSETPSSNLPNEPLAADPSAASQAAQSAAISDDATTPAGGSDESASANETEGSEASKQSSAGSLPALLVSTMVLAVIGFGLSMMHSSAVTSPANELQEFSKGVETQLQTPRAGFEFGKLTCNKVQINAFHMATFNVGATWQSDQSHAEFTFQYFYVDGRWILEDAEVSGEKSAKEAAESELARGAESELLGIFSPAQTPRDDFYRQRARGLNEEDEYDKAIAYCNEALRVDGNDAESYFLRGCAWLGKEEYDRAFEDCSEALRLDPRSADAYAVLLVRGLASTHRFRYDEAIEDFTQSLRLEPDNAETLCCRSVAWVGMREYDKALEDCSEALRLVPEMAHAWMVRAWVWIRKEDYRKAIEDANQGFEVDPDHAPLHSLRGQAIFLSHDDYEQAMEDGRNAIRLDPENALAYKVLAQIQATCTDDRFRDGTNALANADRALQCLDVNDGNRWRFVDTLAAAHAESGQFDKAVQWQNKAIELLAQDKYATHQEEEELRSRLELYQQGKPYREEPHER